MKTGQIFATSQAAVCIGASVGYATQKDWWRALYWAFAAGITLTVTFGGGK